MRRSHPFEHRLDPERAGFLGDNRGWGFGVAVVTRRDNVAAEPGRYGWDGGLGTSWFTDPTEGKWWASS